MLLKEIDLCDYYSESYKVYKCLQFISKCILPSYDFESDMTKEKSFLRLLYIPYDMSCLCGLKIEN